MAKTITNSSFDYSILDKETGGKLYWYADAIRKQGVIHVETGLEMGRMLREARDLCEDGKAFRDWVPLECGCSIRTAYNYMEAFSEFGECANFAKIELSAMYALTKNSRAKTKALKMAGNGLTVTHAIAKDLIEAESNCQKDAVNSEPDETPKFVDSADPWGEDGEDDSTESTGTEQPQEPAPPPPSNGKDKPGVTAKTGRDKEVWEAQQTLKGWADAVGRWMNGNPAGIDVYRERFPGKTGDRVIEAAKELYNSLEAWKKGLK